MKEESWEKPFSLEKKLYEFLGTGREKTEAEKLMEEHFSYVYPFEKSTIEVQVLCIFTKMKPWRSMESG